MANDQGGGWGEGPAPTKKAAATAAWNAGAAQEQVKKKQSKYGDVWNPVPTGNTGAPWGTPVPVPGFNPYNPPRPAPNRPVARDFAGQPLSNLPLPNTSYSSPWMSGQITYPTTTYNPSTNWVNKMPSLGNAPGPDYSWVNKVPSLYNMYGQALPTVNQSTPSIDTQWQPPTSYGPYTDLQRNKTQRVQMPGDGNQIAGVPWLVPPGPTPTGTTTPTAPTGGASAGAGSGSGNPWARKSTYKRSYGRGGGGGGGGYYYGGGGGGGSGYTPSAWASLVGWNINR